MYLIRRIAVRAVSQLPSRQLSSTRPHRVTNLQSSKPILSRAFHNSRIWQVGEEQRKLDEEGQASPAEAKTSGETVTTEPSAAEEHIQEESIATPETADASQQHVADDAVSEALGTTAESLRHQRDPSSRSSQSTHAQTFTEQAKDIGSSAAETARSTASAATQAAQSTFNAATAPFRRSSFPPRDAPAPPHSGNLRDPPPSRILYVGNLFFEVTAPQLEQEFREFGEITNSRIVTDSRGLSKGFAYVEFATQDQADRAIRELDQKIFQGRRMAVQYHIRREPRGMGSGMGLREPNPPNKTLFIGNMSYQMSDKDLNDLFREIRNVLDVRVAIDRRSGQPRGFAHADFIDVESAQKAKAHLEKKVVYGRQLKVDFGKPSNPTQNAEQDS